MEPDSNDICSKSICFDTSQGQETITKTGMRNWGDSSKGFIVDYAYGDLGFNHFSNYFWERHLSTKPCWE